MITSTVFSTQSAIKIGIPDQKDAEDPRRSRRLNQGAGDLEIQRIPSVRIDAGESRLWGDPASGPRM